MSLSLDSVASPAARQYLALKSATGIGPILAQRLIAHFDGIDGVFAASVRELAQVERMSSKRAGAVQAMRDQECIGDELQLAAERGVRIVCPLDEDYPAALTYIDDPPVCLYVAGDIRRQDMLAMAIVGARRCTRYGAEQARRFGTLLAQAGFTVVSGLARGVDGLAHEGALEAGGRTVAVLGNGLTEIYPAEHTGLAERIRQSGAVISELPMTTPPDSGNFQPRNRVIAGMCLGTLVIEATQRSGALLTARFATEYNREVFAIPGRIDTPEAAGTNARIRNGEAKLVTCLADILDELGEVGRLMPFAGASNPETPTEQAVLSVERFDENQQRVLNALGSEELTVDTLVDETGLPISKITSTLMSLQLCGAVRQLPGQRFVCLRGNSPS